MKYQPFWLSLLSPQNQIITMGKDSHFTGQPVYSQVLKLLDREKILRDGLHFRNEE